MSPIVLSITTVGKPLAILCHQPLKLGIGHTAAMLCGQEGN